MGQLDVARARAGVQVIGWRKVGQCREACSERRELVAKVMACKGAEGDGEVDGKGLGRSMSSQWMVWVLSSEGLLRMNGRQMTGW